MRWLFLYLGVAAVVIFSNSPVAAQARLPTVPVLLDTDIGTARDDAFALALALASPEVDLRGITTVHGDAYARALLVCRMLYLVGRGDVPIASGRPRQDPPDYRDQLQYGLRPPSRKKPRPEQAVDFLYDQFRTHPGERTLLAIGPLTNAAELLRQHPECKPWIKRIVLMGGAIHVGYNGKPPAAAEWNIRTDIKAAQTVFGSGIPLVVAPLDATTGLQLEKPLRQRLFGAGTPLTQQLHALFQLGDESTPTLFDPVAVMLCFEEKLCTMENESLPV